MLDAVTTGSLLFWGGMGAAYAGVIAFPAMAKNQVFALWLLLLSGVIGWITMVCAAMVYDYGRAWIEMPASLIFGGICIAISAILIHGPPKQGQR